MRAATRRRRLLDWYDRTADVRGLPWRVGPADRRGGARADPYAVWLSEIMLQQTTAPHAAPYFLTFTRRWPTVEALAAADDAEVMSAWAGLGYYARARNLLACARRVAREFDGRFPNTQDGLAALPGVGPYTAAAVAAIAFDTPCVPVDGNVERVMARLAAIETPLPAAKVEIRREAAALAGDERPGDLAQALMDLGALVCRPRTPDCGACPLADGCAARASGSPERFPVRGPRAARPRRFGSVIVATFADEVALVPRPPRGLLGGMLGLPTSAWTEGAPAAGPPLDVAPPVRAPVRAGQVEHVFTHFTLTLEVWRAEADVRDARYVWTDLRGLDALPSVFLKAARLALG